MYSLVGIVAFTVGLGLFVFPLPIFDVLSNRFKPLSSHGSTVVARAFGIALMALGFALVLR